ncbi:MAG: amino acid adenylation domain-containing protein, partial [Bacteroidota bacterium]
MRLTLSQQDVYYEQLLYPNEPIYNIGAKISIEGPLQYKALNVAYVALINQHDSARIVFREKGGQHQMRILDVHKSKLALIDFSQHEDPLAAAEAYMLQEFAKAFDLSTGELLHTFTLLKVREDFHYLYTCFHHLIIDGWGTSVMFQRLVANYNEILERGAIRSSYPYSYKDFMTEDASYEGSEEYELDKSYWVNRFETLPTPLVQSRSHDNALQRSKRASLTVSRAVYDQLGELAKTCKASTFQVLLASLFLYFGRKYRNTNFAIGLPVLNRSKRLYKQTVGLFMGVSPLHIPLDFEASFADLVSKIKHQLRQDYRHQRFPLGKLIQELQVFQQQGRLFDIMLSYQKQDFSQHFTDTYTRVLPLTHHAELNGMAIFIREFDPREDVTIDFDYNLNYFDPVEMQTAMIHLEQLLHDILQHPDRPLRAFQYLPKEEREQLLHGFNQSSADYPRDSTFLAEFERQVTLQASKIAVADAQQQLSYAALQSQSNQIAHYLDEQFGVEDRSPVAVLMERSADLIVVLMGILKSGRAYIPLDPAFPQERLAYILQHSQSKILIQDNAYELAEDASIHKIQLEELKEAIKELPVGHQSRATWSNTAYIIYTSGSTGRPKGVEIGHRALLNFLWSMREQPGIVPTDHWFSVTTASFDISILEFFGPLMAGATLYIADRELLGQPKELMSSMATVKPTIVQATPSFYQLLYHAGWKGQKGTKILCGGDLLSQSLAKKLLRDHEELWNMYGPTEATIWCSCKRLRHHSEASNIGKPIQNTQLYLLDPWGHPCPIGEQGQLFIGGEGLAKGYFRAPELTASKFRNNPYAKGRLYESGDLGKWTKDGEIEFLGRNDHQVKIRGYRVELEEIENQLHQIEGIV